MAETCRYAREGLRLNASGLLRTLQMLFPTWSWQLIEGSDENLAHFCHVNFENDEVEAVCGIDTDRLYTRLACNSIEYSAVLALPDGEADVSTLNHIYYGAEGAERLLVTYRAWARQMCSQEEYELISDPILAYFASGGRPKGCATI